MVIRDEFLEAIKKRKSAPYHWIMEYYSKEYFLAIVDMLQQMGIKDEEYFTFDQKKKKSRFTIPAMDIIKICYHIADKDEDYGCNPPLEINGKYISIACWYEYHTGIPGLDANWRCIGDYEIEILSGLYNYLRLEKRRRVQQ
nr:hypothetical protein [uncultured Prevotella sp.]